MLSEKLAAITTQVLFPVEVEKCIAKPEFGAQLSFVGVVRDHDPEAAGEVVSLSYTAHPDAERILADIVNRHSRDATHIDGEIRVAAHHRIGDLEVGDVALVVSVAAAHRSHVFEVCSSVVEEIKASVPIWKKQHTRDGAACWVGM